MVSKPNEIVANIRSAILSRRLLPGTQLREMTLCRLYGVSRTLVRQALQELGKDGLVDLTHGRIATVAQPTAREAHEVFDMRVALESHATRTLIARAAKKDFTRLRSHLKEERSAHARGNTEEVQKLGAGFHVLMARLAGNALLVQSLERLLARIALILQLYQHDYDSHTQCLQDEHEELIDLMQAGREEEALALLLRHLHIVEASLRIQDFQATADLQLARALDLVESTGQARSASVG